ncbi:hypothetical protein CPT_Silvanus_021 [Stenotrophomonas phage Silvanus]|nr:hypothetical protein CPT_Silvanus_021 [Stenotrophomonas phage Silvanus]
MPSGIQVWDDQGRLVVDYTTRLSQSLGGFALGDNHAAGSMNVPEFALGKPYVIVMSEQKFKSDGQVRKVPQAFASGTTLSWDAGDACYINYGIY